MSAVQPAASRTVAAARLVTANGDFEGFGMVLVEAQACGKPVIAGASGGTKETMRMPETGLILPCEGSEKLTEAVTELLVDVRRREEMGRAARQWVEQQFDWSTLAEQAARVLGMEAAGAETIAKGTGRYVAL